MPLPPYIAGRREADARDREDYQTMFARRGRARSRRRPPRSTSRPRLMAALAEAGIGHETLTLHVGAGTFLPVKAEDTADHRDAQPNGAGSTPPTADRLNAARAAGGRIIPVGTTSLRLLESAADEDGRVRAVRGRHRHLHHPRLPLPGDRRPDHQLPSAALDPVHAGLGADGAGDDAGRLCPCDREGYRFYSYGDASLLLP